MNALQAYAARYAKQPEQATKPTHAWVSLIRLGGCNIKSPVSYRGKSVYVTAQGHTYRLNAAPFIAGERQYRDGWCIELWGEKAERTTKAEANWQT